MVTVLHELRHRRARSRSEIVSRTGLTRAMVAQRVADLVDLGLVVVGDPGPSTGGRPARELRFRANSGHVLVADLGATSIDVAVTALDGRILGHAAEPADIADGPELLLGRVSALFENALETSPSVQGGLWGVGIGVPGPVEFETGMPVSPPIMPGWDRYPIRDRLVGRWEAPTWVDNDVNLYALGEWRSGVAQGHDDFIFIKIGTGIGAGIMSGGQLHRGMNGSAGDVGHIQMVDSSSVVCRCGNIGCLEALAGGAAIGRQGEAAARAGSSPFLASVLDRQGTVTSEDVASAAAHGDRIAVDLLQAAGRWIGSMLAGIVNFFNPSLVVVGGGVAQSGDVLLAGIREVVYRRSLPLATRDLLIQRSSLGTLAGVQGASMMVLDQLFSRETVARWIYSGSPAEMPELAAPAVA